ncbi:MAG: hypothetical protein KAS72_14630 [Phycisphaerales bacterium]|nr:hypothetical protein [Phycisphaerales bacterium]
MSTPSAQRRFLNLSTDADGPFELLGLDPSPQPTSQQIDEALKRRLAQVDVHPQARTPEADQVRMALHAAAAVLRDKQLRRMLQPESVSDAAPRTAQPRPSPTEPARPAHALPLSMLESAIIAALLRERGWNSRSQHRLVGLAMQWGMQPGELVETIRQLAARWSTSALAPDAAEDAASHRPITLTGRTPWGARIAVCLAITTGIVAVSLAVWGVMQSGRRASHVPQQPRLTQAPPAEEGAKRTPDMTSPVTVVEPDAQPEVQPPPVGRSETDDRPPTQQWQQANVIRECRAIITTVTAQDTPPTEKTISGVQRIMAGIARRWPTLPHADREQLHWEVVHLLIAIAGADTTGSTVSSLLVRLDPIDGPSQHLSADDVWIRSWSAGIRARLSVEPDMSDAVRRVLRESLDWRADAATLRSGTSPGLPPFERGALARLHTMMPALAAQIETAEDGESAWTRWRKAVSVIRSAGGLAGPDDDYLIAVHAILSAGPEPTNGSRTALLVQRLLGATVLNRPNTIATVIQWLIDPRLTSLDMHVVTVHMVEHLNLDSSMILPAGASGEQRSYITRQWSRHRMAVGSPPTTDTPATRASDRHAYDPALRYEWETLVRRVLDRSVTGTSPTDCLTRAVRYARLAEAASLMERCDVAAAHDRLGSLDASLAVARPTQHNIAPRDGVLTTELLTPGLSDPIRADRIQVFASRYDVIGLADARTLAAVALTESSESVRAAAQQAVRGSYASSPTMMLALLDQLAKARPQRSPALVRMFEAVTAARLPDARSRDLVAAARLALVQRLLETRPSAVIGGAVDELAAMLAASYHVRRGGDANPASPEAEAWELFEQWRKRAVDVGATLPGDDTPDQVRRRLAASCELADGSLQRFVALQIAIVEEMAALAVAEHPEQVDAVMAVMHETRRSTHSAQDIVTQVETLERAILRLWLLRVQSASVRRAAT